MQTVFDNETSLYSPLKTPFSLFLSLHILSGRVVPTEHVAEKNRGEKWLATQAEGPINVHKSSSVTYTHTLSQPCRHI